MPPISFQLPVAQRLQVFHNARSAELTDIDSQRHDARQSVITDHVISPNPFGCDDIYDEVAAHFRGEPVGTVPSNTYGFARQRVTPALLEAVWPGEVTKLRSVV